MEVGLSAERERYVRQIVDRGLYPSAAHAVEAALRLLELRDRSGPTIDAVALGLEQVIAGRSMPVTSDDVVRQAMRRGYRR